MLTPTVTKFFNLFLVSQDEKVSHLRYPTMIRLQVLTLIKPNYSMNISILFSNTLTSEVSLQSSANTITDIHFCDSDVLDLLLTLDDSKACDINNLSPKSCALPLLQIVCHLFRTSLLCSTIPCDWRTHCIVPVLNLVTSPLYATIYPFHCCVFCLRYWKKLYITTLSIIIH